MKNRIWLAVGLIFVISSIAFGQTSKRTITNLDLEKFKQQREKSEAEYRAKYKELGMPSPEELEKRNVESQRSLENYAQNARIQKQQNQDNWQARAIPLRNEIANINAQISFLNRQIANLPSQTSVFYPSQVYSSGGLNYSDYGGGYVIGGGGYVVNNVGNTANNVQTAINASAANPNPYYGTPLYSTGIKAVIGPNLPRRGSGRRYGYGNYYPYQVANSNSFQREELISRLQYLGQVRAGLLAQWRNLVEDAHRAGVRLD